MITDRTQTDVVYAKLHRNSTTDLKGCYNTSDLNRVESKVAELETLLKNYNYFNGNLTTKINWARNEFIRTQDGTRYLNNIQTLINSYYTKSTTPNVPSDLDRLTYIEANNIEQILVDIEALINNMVAEFRYSGTFNSGESEGLI